MRLRWRCAAPLRREAGRALSGYKRGAGGEVYAWGCAGDGRLGVGEGTEYDFHTGGRACFTPRRLKSLPADVTQISCGSAHTALLDSTGAVWTCGLGSSGQLGHGDTRSAPEARRVSSLPPCAHVAAGASHTLAVSTEGFVFAFGSGAKGELGVGRTPKAVSTPTLVRHLADVGARAVRAAANHFSSAVLTDGGELYTFGSAAHGRLGHGEPPPWSVWRPFSDLRQLEPEPRLVRALRSEPVASVVVGSTQMLATLRSGEVVGWGDGRGWAFGSRTNVPVFEPAECVGLTRLRVERIALGFTHGVGITFDGEIVTWGFNEFGCLGTGSLLDTHVQPTRPRWFVEHRENIGRIHGIAAGMNFCVMCCQGGVYTWGSGESGKRGVGGGDDSWLPQGVLLQGEGGRSEVSRPLLARSVSANILHAAALA